MTTQDLEPTIEVRHLRRLLDTLPSCLMRVAANGQILAANNAACDLLGVWGLGEALVVSLPSRIPPEQYEAWQAFVGQVLTGSRGSFTSELIRADVHRRVLLHGIVLADHPDGIPSIVVVAQDITDRIHLENTIEQQEGPLRQLAVMQTQLDKAAAAQQLLEQRLQDAAKEQRQGVEATEGQMRQAHAERTATLERLDELLAERGRLEEQSKQLREDQESARAATARAEADRQRVQTALDERQAQLHEMDTERAAAMRQLDEAVTARHQIEERLQGLTKEHQAQLHTGAQVAADREQFRTALEECERQLRQATAECTTALRELDEAGVLRLQLEERLRDSEARELQSTADAVADRARLQQAFDAVTEQHLAALEAVSRTAADRLQLQALLDEHQARLHQLDADRGAALARLDEAVAERYRLEERLQQVEARHRQGAAALSAALQVTVAPQLRELADQVDGLASGLRAEYSTDSASRPDVERLRAEGMEASTLTGELLSTSSELNAPRAAREYRAERATGQQ